MQMKGVLSYEMNFPVGGDGKMSAMFTILPGLNHCIKNTMHSLLLGTLIKFATQLRR